MSRPVTIVRSDSDEEVQMQAPASNINQDDMDCGITNIPCCFGQRSRFQQLATSGRFYLLLIILAIILSVVEGYIYSSAKHLTNLFKFPTLFFDLLIVVNGFFQGLVAISVAYWGKRIHRAAWLGGLACLFGAFCVITIIPYVGPSDTFTNLTSTGPRLCAREPSQLIENDDRERGGVTMMIALVMLFVFFSLVNISFWSHGLSYLDDSVEPDKIPNYIGLLLGLKLTMVKNGYSLFSLFVDHPKLWWIPFAVFGSLLIILGTVIASFPLKLISTIVKQTAASILDIASGNSNENLEQIRKVHRKEEFWPTIKRVATNKIIMLDTVALGLFAMAVCNFDNYENAFLQAQYHIPYTNDFVDPWTSRKMGDLFKTVMIILLTAVAGLSFSRFSTNINKMTSFILLMGIHAIMIYVSFIFLDCKTSTIVGDQGSRYLTPLCSHDCQCRSAEVIFEPVCIIEGSQTYFSPCHAGCTTSAQISNIFVYGNCTCGPHPDYLLGSGPLTSATRGACSANDCFGQWTVFQVFYIVNIALAASTLVAHLLLALRCVRPSDKATAIGFMLAGIGLIVYLPGHYIYKLISDQTCHFWNADGYNCNLHGARFPDILAGVTAGIVFISCIINAVVVKLARNIEKEDDKIKAPAFPLDDSSREIEGEPILQNRDGNQNEVNMYHRQVFRTTQI